MGRRSFRLPVCLCRDLFTAEDAEDAEDAEEVMLVPANTLECVRHVAALGGAAPSRERQAGGVYSYVLIAEKAYQSLCAWLGKAAAKQPCWTTGRQCGVCSSTGGAVVV